MNSLRARLALLLTALFFAGLPVPAWAQSVAACQHIPPVHHRMYGHTGSTREGDGLENTVKGMRRTWRHGGRWFETDAQAVRNKHGKRIVVLFHDYRTGRTTNLDNENGGRVLRNMMFEDLPLTTAGQPIPTFGDLLAWLDDHKRTHALVEIKMDLPWRRVVRALKRHEFDGTHRVMFDIGGGEKAMRKHETALAMKDRLGPHAVTGLKRWDPKRRPAEYLRQFGTGVRLGLGQGINHKRELIDAGVTTRFSKILNGGPRAPPLWRRAVRSGAFTHIITEETEDYLAWCDRVSSVNTADAVTMTARTPEGR